MGLNVSAPEKKRCNPRIIKVFVEKYPLNVKGNGSARVF